MHETRIGLICVLLLVSHGASAVPPAGASTIRVQADCGTDPSCFIDMSDALDWVWNTRVPTSTDRVFVDVGPGVWEAFSCPGADPPMGYVSIRGAGRESTVFGGAGAFLGGLVDDCEELEFKDVRFEGDGRGFVWANEGSATFTDVDVVATGVANSMGFLGGPCPSTLPAPGEPTRPVLRFFGSRITSHGNDGIAAAAGFVGECVEAWFYGGEILWLPEEGGSVFTFPYRAAAVSVGANGHFHAFGTAIRTVAKDLATPFTVPVHGVAVATRTGVPTSEFFGEPASFQIHGGIISLTVEPGQSNSEAIGLVVEGSGAIANTADAAFVVNAPQGKKRVQTIDGGQADAPFLWQSGTQPPTASAEQNELTSVDGLDLFVETDCDSTGVCTAGNETHLMVYNAAACPASDPWFNIVTGRCRGVGPP